MDLLKPSLIDLEIPAGMTGGKQPYGMQPERLSGKAARIMPMRQSELSYNAKKKGERKPEVVSRLKRGHKSNRLYGYHSAVRVTSSTTGSGAVAKGTSLVGCQTAWYALENAGKTGTQANCYCKGFALAANASYTTKAIAAFILCL